MKLARTNPEEIKVMKNANYLITVLFFILASSVSSEDLAEGVNRLSASIKDSAVVLNAEIHTADFNANHKNKLPDMWGGLFENSDESATLIKVITSLNVEINGKKVFVPFSSYGDLAQPRLTGISTDRDGFVITITGGVDAPSYNARLFFTSEGIKSKTVTSTTDPQVVWEETFYSIGESN
ncbi:MAG TPA: hypothetical protein VHP63_06490 [candidate division Zixibacteria bacterium]|nr:hypothetical protein [candidate division Zixibacteria bacterium]